MIERALAQHAGPAPDVWREHHGVRGGQAGASRARRSARTSRSRGTPSAGAEMHRARVVRDERAALREHAGERREIGPPDEIDGRTSCRAPHATTSPPRHVGAGGRVGRAADQHAGDAVAGERRRQRRERLGRPAFRAAVRRARRKRDERRRPSHPADASTSARRAPARPPARRGAARADRSRSRAPRSGADSRAPGAPRAAGARTARVSSADRASRCGSPSARGCRRATP